jgi:lipid-A-disaccharide synthase-like uncharacterized protein
MRKKLFVTGWIVFFALPLAYIVQIVVTQDLPPVEWWKWSILFATVVLIYASRNRDDVLKHHVV